MIATQTRAAAGATSTAQSASAIEAVAWPDGQEAADTESDPSRYGRVAASAGLRCCVVTLAASRIATTSSPPRGPRVRRPINTTTAASSVYGSGFAIAANWSAT